MAKIKIPENLKGKELYKFLVENKSALIQEKKALPKCAESVSFEPSIYQVKEGSVIKALANAPELQDENTLRVKVVANTANWCDSHMDVLIPDSGLKSIKERKGYIPHLHDHIHKIEAQVGDVVGIYYQDVALTELGINKSGSTQCLIFETDIKKDYNKLIFEKYKAGKINQHSIGLWYVKIELAINDEESEKEFDFWNKYIGQVINREMVEEKGYFWVVTEYKLIENSAVLFGSNQLTPTLEIEGKSDDTETEPPVGTPDQPSDQNKSMLSQIGSGLKKESVFAQLGKQF